MIKILFYLFKINKLIHSPNFIPQLIWTPPLSCIVPRSFITLVRPMAGRKPPKTKTHLPSVNDRLSPSLKPIIRCSPQTKKYKTSLSLWIVLNSQPFKKTLLTVGIFIWARATIMKWSEKFCTGEKNGSKLRARKTFCTSSGPRASGGSSTSTWARVVCVSTILSTIGRYRTRWGLWGTW